MIPFLHFVDPSSRAQADNLWQNTLDTLGDDVKGSLVIRNAPRRDILAAVQRTAEERKQLCLYKRWKFKKPNGEEIILRDIFDKILTWLDRFKSIGDIAMQCDAAHAALPWTAVRFLLNVAVSEKRVHGLMVEGLEVVARLSVRFTIFEDIYLRRCPTPHLELETAVIQLYAEILHFLGKATLFFQQRPRIREKVNHTVHVILVQPVEDDQMQKIAAKEATVLDLARLIDAQLGQDTNTSIKAVRDLLIRIEAPMERLALHTNASFSAVQQDYRLEILCWLSPVPFSRHHEAHSESRISTTGQWLFDHTHYRDWDVPSSSTFLLLHRVPGSGKTALASAVVDHFLRQNSRQPSSTGLAYFYCSKNASEPERSDPDKILRSLLRQLTFSRDQQRTVYKAIIAEYERRKAEAKLDGFDIPRLRGPECLKLAVDILGQDPAVLIVDAVDEIQEPRRHELINALEQLVVQCASVVKIFITSRNESRVLKSVREAHRICVNSIDNRSDMETFVHHRLDCAIQSRRLLNGEVSNALRQMLIRALLNSAGEMFLWVILQVENLCRLKLDIDVKGAAERLSQDGLEELYATAYHRIQGSTAKVREIASRAFSWLLCSRESFTPGASIKAVLALETDGSVGDLGVSQLCDICSNLIMVDTKMNTVRFTHISVQEYLESRSEYVFQLANVSAALSCVEAYVSCPPSNLDSTLHLAEDFSHYATLYWVEHCRIATMSGESHELDQKIQRFVFDDDEVSLCFIGWVDDVRHLQRHLPNKHDLKKAIFPRRGSGENGVGGNVMKVNVADVVDARWCGGRHS
ncbi:MAG: hypothetical protein L6R36_005628 [Xanthoria steineri]|nr:MAG: hypothetical protein L6R36_005628 [Xanthoria steineri]